LSFIDVLLFDTVKYMQRKMRMENKVKSKNCTSSTVTGYYIRPITSGRLRRAAHQQTMGSNEIPRRTMETGEWADLKFGGWMVWWKI
jgi:hypothetical protein